MISLIFTGTILELVLHPMLQAMVAGGCSGAGSTAASAVAADASSAAPTCAIARGLLARWRAKVPTARRGRAHARARVLPGKQNPARSRPLSPDKKAGQALILLQLSGRMPALPDCAPRLATVVGGVKLAAVSEQISTQIKQLLATPELPVLGPQPRAGRLSEADLNARLIPLLRESRLSALRQELVRALLLLWHDHLDASHNISQSIENADGSFVHAIMHRREPDYWNAKYWWRRVGAHPAFPEIARRVNELLTSSRRREEADLAQQLLPGGNWDAAAFVDLCEQATTDSRHVTALREIQRIETEVLLETFLS